jgi:hypothetical protein
MNIDIADRDTYLIQIEREINIRKKNLFENQNLFNQMRTKLYILLLLGCTITQEMYKMYGVNAITEDENEISLKDLTKEK